MKLWWFRMKCRIIWFVARPYQKYYSWRMRRAGEMVERMRSMMKKAGWSRQRTRAYFRKLGSDAQAQDSLIDSMSYAGKTRPVKKPVKLQRKGRRQKRG